MALSLVTANGLRVIAGSVYLPRVGVWRADLQIDTPTALGGPLTRSQATLKTVAASLAIGPLNLSGAVSEGDQYAGSAFAQLVGGANGLSRPVPAKSYRGAPISLILADIVAAGGEKLSATSTKSILGTALQFWELQGGQRVSDALRALAELTGASWRFLPDGSLFFGLETWPASTLKSPGDYLTSENLPQQGYQQIATLLFAGVLPGMTFEGHQVRAVQHSIEGNGVRTDLWFE